MSDRCMKRSKLISRTKLLLEYQVVIGEILSLFQHLISCSFTSVDGCRVEHLLFKGVCHLWLHFHVSKLHGIPSDAGKFEKKPGIPIKSKHKLTLKLKVQDGEVKKNQGVLEWSKMYPTRLCHPCFNLFRFVLISDLKYNNNTLFIAKLENLLTAKKRDNWSRRLKKFTQNNLKPNWTEWNLIVFM